jgi:hypothetical protein
MQSYTYSGRMGADVQGATLEPKAAKALFPVEWR